MESTNTTETLLWLVTIIIASGMIAMLTIGWMKGNQWQRELKLKKRQTQR